MAAVAVSAAGPNYGVISASNVQVMPVQVFTRNTATNVIDIFNDDVARALSYVINTGQLGWKVSAVVMSFGFGLPHTTPCDGSPLAGYIDSLNGFGTAVIGAAGNVFSSSTSSATNVYEFWGVDEPACVSSAIAVGATLDYTDTAAVNVWTSYGNFFSTQSHDQLLDYWAPGAYIETPVAAAEIFGTSFSAPHVAGVWTRLRGRYPYASNDYIRSLLASCPLVSDGRGNIPTVVTKPRICWKTAWQ